MFYYESLRSQDGAVGIATGYLLDVRRFRVRVPVWSRNFSCPLCPDRHWTHQIYYPVDTGDLSTGLNRPGRETDHSPPSSADVKKTRVFLIFGGCVRYYGLFWMCRQSQQFFKFVIFFIYFFDRLCGLMVRVPGYRSRGPGSISDATRFSEK
jgi:hypothetical protein